MVALSTWVNDLVDLTEYDSLHVWEQIEMERSMNKLFSAGNVEIWKGKEEVRIITKYREEEIPIAGTNYYYAVKKRSPRIFEYFEVFVGCPGF